MAINNLGITELEQKQMDALSIGVSREEIANVTRQSINQVPEYIPTTYYEDDGTFVPDPGYSDFLETKQIGKKTAARKSLFAALAEEGDIPENYTTMYQQYIDTGESPTYEAIKRQLGEDNYREYIEVLEQTAAEGEGDNLETLLEAAPAVLAERSDPRFRGIENASQGFTEGPGTIERKVEYQKNFLEGIEDWAPVRERVSALVNSHVADNDISIGKYVSDIQDIVFTGEQIVGLSNVGKEILGERYYAFGGSMMRDLAQSVLALPVNKREEQAKKIIDSIVENAGVFKNNDFVKTYALQSFEHFLNTPGGDDPLERWITDVFGVVDVASILPVATGVRLLRRIGEIKFKPSAVTKYNGTTSEIAEVNPDLDAALRAAALKDEKAAESLGTTPHDELGKTLPGNVLEDGSMLDGAPSSIIEKVNGEKTRVEELSDFIDNTYMYTSDEYKNKIGIIEGVLRGEKVAAHAKPSKSSYVQRSDEDNSVITSYVYGDDTDLDLTDLAKVRELSNTVKEGLQDVGITSTPRIIVKDKATGTYEPFDPKVHVNKSVVREMDVETPKSLKSIDPDINKITLRAANLIEVNKELPKKTKAKLQREFDSEVLPNGSIVYSRKDRFKTPDTPMFQGSYLVSVDVKTPMTWNDILPGTQLGEGATKGVGTLGKYLINPQSYIDQSLLGAARVANDRKFFIKHNMLKLAQPFLSLGYFGKKRVANLLEVGEENKIVYSFRELEKKGYSLKEAEAYYSARLFNDAVYRLKNLDLHEKLTRDGFKSVNLPDAFDGTGFSNGISVVENPKSLMSKVKNVFDPMTGKTVSLTEEAIDGFEKNGLVVGKVLRRIDTDDEAFTYVIVPGNSISELPRNVIPYHTGYNFRINNDPYFIDRTQFRRINGVVEKVNSTIGVARTRNEAARYIEELNIKDPSATYSLRIDRNINSSKSVLDNDIDSLDGSGLQFWFSKRGDRLTRKDGTLSSVEDPITAMHKLSATVANVISHRNLLETATLRHRKTYGNIEVDGKPLWYWDNTSKAWRFDKTIKAPGREDVRAAKREYEYLETLKYTPTAVDQYWKDLLESIDAGMAKLGPVASAASKAVILDFFGSTTPGQAARGAAFAMTIPLRPIRQIFLQGSTGLHLAGISPADTALSMRDANLMLISLATYQNPKRWGRTKSAARALGYKEGEWEELFESFRKSGKAYAIDSNVAIGEANFSWSRSLPQSFAGEVGRWGVNILKSPVTAGKALGFDTGELFNQAATWVFAKRQWIKNNPGKNWKSQRAQDEINNLARAYSVDMTKTDQLGYQKGAFASMTQFMAINHKMLSKILPSFMGGDPNFKGATAKSKYALAMLSIYGAAGLGLQDFYDSWKKESDLDIPPQLDDLFYGGFAQLFFNSGLDLAFGEEFGTTRTAISDSFSPAGGQITFATEFAKHIFDLNFVEAWAGPSAGLIPGIADAYNFSKDVWGMDNLDTHEKVIKSMQMSMEQFGMMSDYFKMNLAMAYREKLDELYVVGKDGRPVAEANTAGEVWSKFLLNIPTRAEQELYSTWIPKRQDFYSSGKAKEAAIDADADRLSKWLYRAYAESGSLEEFAQKAQSLTFSLHKADRVYGMEVWSAARSKFKLDGRFDEFINDVTTRWIQLDPNVSEANLINMINNSDIVAEENKPKIVENIKALTSSREQTKRLLDEL